MKILSLIGFLAFVIVIVDSSTSYYYTVNANTNINTTIGQNFLIESSLKDTVMSCLVFCNLNSFCLNVLYSASERNCTLFSKYFNTNETFYSMIFDLNIRNSK